MHAHVVQESRGLDHESVEESGLTKSEKVYIEAKCDQDHVNVK